MQNVPVRVELSCPLVLDVMEMLLEMPELI